MKHRNYLYEYDNRVIVCFFSIMALLDFIVIVYKKYDIDKIISKSGVSIALVISILLWVFNKKSLIYTMSPKIIGIEEQICYLSGLLTMDY